MRVLLIPELYRPDDATANGTLNDAATWVEQWLALDESLHVYWLLPPRERAGYDRSYVHADRDRVTLLEAEPPMVGDEHADAFTETGYSREQLRALERGIFEAGAYVDVVVDQLRDGRVTLYKWLLEHTDHWAAQVRPFDVVTNVHDLQLPFKYRWCSYRNEYQMLMEICATAFADGAWFTAGVDARRLRERGAEYLRASVLDDALDDAVVVGSPVDFDEFEEAYAATPEWLHVAGSFWEKKHADLVFAVAETLHERHGVRTVLTSMDEIPTAYREPSWVEAHAECPRERYEAALRRGDLAVCASEYETMARTPFEQAASGQVLVLRDEPWIYDCVPEDYRLAADGDDLTELTTWAVEHWDEAVAANRRLVEHARRVRRPERVGRRTYDDLRRRVDAKVERYDPGENDRVVRRALADADGAVALDDLRERTTAYADGATSTDRETCPDADLVYALRSLGYADAGGPGTPVFERTDDG